MTKKQEEIKKILLTPIKCDAKSEKIKWSGNKILSTQKYYGRYDEDMSDFAVGFYEIIYKDILCDKTILTGKYFTNKNFAGDTMNSFHSIANRVPESGKSRKTRTLIEKWPIYLQKYYSKYLCLANFWIIPMKCGRTLRGALNKASFASDYMDRYLELLNIYPFNEKNDKNTDGFCIFKNRKDFYVKHMILGSYIKANYQIDYFSEQKNSPEDVVKKILNKIDLRATSIAEKYCDELYAYFKELTLL